MAGKDPTAVIRKALAETLVPYYPFASRLREGREKKLVVQYTGEGMMFIEADADVRHFGEFLQPPFPLHRPPQFLSLPLPRFRSGKNLTIP
ncbi:Benzyl alcohol O-benzoyltransferase [Linum perenne]